MADKGSVLIADADVRGLTVEGSARHVPYAHLKAWTIANLAIGLTVGLGFVIIGPEPNVCIVCIGPRRPVIHTIRHQVPPF